jgi:hypothetical protein
MVSGLMRCIRNLEAEKDGIGRSGHLISYFSAG